MVPEPPEPDDAEKKGTREFCHKEGITMKKHNCGNGFKGTLVKSHGVVFCGFCGHEFE